MWASPVGKWHKQAAANSSSDVNEFKGVDEPSFLDFKYTIWVRIKSGFKADWTSGTSVDFLPINW